MAVTLADELKNLADELSAVGDGVKAVPQVAETIKRLTDMSNAFKRESIVAVKVKTVQQRRAGTPFVMGDMVYLERQ